MVGEHCCQPPSDRDRSIPRWARVVICQRSHCHLDLPAASAHLIGYIPVRRLESGSPNGPTQIMADWQHCSSVNFANGFSFNDDLQILEVLKRCLRKFCNSSVNNVNNIPLSAMIALRSFIRSPLNWLCIDSPASERERAGERKREASTTLRLMQRNL